MHSCVFPCSCVSSNTLIIHLFFIYFYFILYSLFTYLVCVHVQIESRNEANNSKSVSTLN